METPALTEVKGKIAVIGGTGKLGRNVVLQLSSLGIPTKCLVRSLTNVKIEETSSRIEQNSSSTNVARHLSTLDGVELIQGDVTNRDNIVKLLQDCSACIAVYGSRRSSKISDILPFTNPEDVDSTHPKQVNYEGVRNIIYAMDKTPCCNRLVRITGKGESPFNKFSILINLFGSMAKAWNYEGEQLLRKSDIDYTIIRPGVMASDKSKVDKDNDILGLADNGEDLPVSSVSYEQIANLCIQCLRYPNTKKSTLTAMNVKKGERTYAPLLQKVRPDSRKFPDNLLQLHYKAVRLGGFVLFSFLSSILGGVFLILKSLFLK